MQVAYKNGLGVQLEMVKAFEPLVTVLVTVTVAVSVVLKRRVRLKLEAKLDARSDTELTPGKAEATLDANIDTRPKRRPTHSFCRPTMSTSTGELLDDSKPSNALMGVSKLTACVVSSGWTGDGLNRSIFSSSSNERMRGFSTALLLRLQAVTPAAKEAQSEVVVFVLVTVTTVTVVLVIWKAKKRAVGWICWASLSASRCW